MNSARKHLLRLATALCSNDEVQLREILSCALAENIDILAVREVILTSYLFDGYPTALEGFRILQEITETTTSSATENDYIRNLALWRSRGETLCRQIYGKQYSKLLERIESFAPELSNSMLIEGYGKVLSRPDLDIQTRELCVVVMLAYKGRFRQLLSHAIGSLRVGASEAELYDALETVKSMLPSKNYETSFNLLRDAVSAFKKN